MKNPLAPIAHYKLRYQDLFPFVLFFILVIGLLFFAFKVTATVDKIQKQVSAEYMNSGGVVVKFISRKERLQILKRIEAHKKKYYENKTKR